MHNFERYCKDYENIENYEKAKKDGFKGWCCHHRQGVYIPREELKTLGMYYNVLSDELIFLTESEHDILHKKGKSLSEEHKKKLAEAKKGKKLTDETKQKMSETRKGHYVSEATKKKLSKPKSSETKQKMSEAAKGKHWYNNGTINKFCYECPDGFVPGMLRK